MASASVSKSDSACNVAIDPVVFHGNTLFVVQHQNEPYTAMRPIVEGMGLDWRTQCRKLLTNKDRWGVVMLTTPSSGGEQKAHCMPVRKLPAYFSTINAKKVDAKLRGTVIAYQNECDDVLWSHWTKRCAPSAKQFTQVALPASTLTPEQKKIISDAVHVKVQALPSNLWPKGYAEAWGRVKNKFNVAEYKDIASGRFEEALDYVKRMQLNIAVQEYGRRVEDLPAPLPVPGFDVEAELARLGEILYDASSSIHKQASGVNMIIGRIQQAAVHRLRAGNLSLADKMRWERILDLCSGTSRMGVDLIETGLSAIDYAARALDGVTRLGRSAERPESKSDH